MSTLSLATQRAAPTTEIEGLVNHVVDTALSWQSLVEQQGDPFKLALYFSGLSTLAQNLAEHQHFEAAKRVAHAIYSHGQEICPDKVLEVAVSFAAAEFAGGNIEAATAKWEKCRDTVFATLGESTETGDTFQRLYSDHLRHAFKEFARVGWSRAARDVLELGESGQRHPRLQEHLGNAFMGALHEESPWRNPETVVKLFEEIFVRFKTEGYQALHTLGFAAQAASQVGDSKLLEKIVSWVDAIIEEEREPRNKALAAQIFSSYAAPIGLDEIVLRLNSMAAELDPHRSGSSLDDGLVEVAIVAAKKGDLEGVQKILQQRSLDGPEAYITVARAAAALGQSEISKRCVAIATEIYKAQNRPAFGDYPVHSHMAKVLCFPEFYDSIPDAVLSAINRQKDPIARVTDLANFALWAAEEKKGDLCGKITASIDSVLPEVQNDPRQSHKRGAFEHMAAAYGRAGAVEKSDSLLTAAAEQLKTEDLEGNEGHRLVALGRLLDSAAIAGNTKTFKKLLDSVKDWPQPPKESVTQREFGMSAVMDLSSAMTPLLRAAQGKTPRVYSSSSSRHAPIFLPDREIWGDNFLPVRSQRGT